MLDTPSGWHGNKTWSTHEPGKEYRNVMHGNVSRHLLGQREVVMLKVTMMYRARGYAVPCCDESENIRRHAALTCAVLYCIVDQVVLGIRILAEGAVLGVRS